MFSMLAMLLAAQFMFLSDRASFWDPDKESADTEQSSAENAPVKPVDFRQFKGKKVLLLVHGFNNTAKDAAHTYHQIYQEIEALSDAKNSPLYDVIIGYLWPGYDHRLEYFSAERITSELAARAGLHLHALSSFASGVDIFAHSMGNRLMLGALNHLSKQEEKTQGFLHFLAKHHPIHTIQNFYSIAAAVADHSIDKNEQYYQSTQQCQNMYVFHSNRDEVLKFLFLIAEREEALGYEGLENESEVSPNIQFIDCSSLVGGHSGYFQVKPLYQFIQKQHANQTLAPNIAHNVELLANGLVARIKNTLN